MSGNELARVLTEAGEVETLIDWMEGEAWAVWEEAKWVAVNPGVTPEERARARCIGERLDQMFAELRELVALEEPES